MSLYCTGDSNNNIGRKCTIEDLKLERCPVNHADDIIIKLMSFIIDHPLIDATAHFIFYSSLANSI